MADYSNLILTGKQVKNTYLTLMQHTGSTVVDAYGNILGISASYSSFATSASWAPGVNGSGTTLYTGSTYEITTSVSLKSISSSFADNSINSVSASWAPVAGLIPGSTQPITSSWSEKSTTSSYAPIEVGYSASVSNQLNTKEPNIVVADTYEITSSWSEKSTTSLFSDTSTSSSHALNSDNSVNSTNATNAVNSTSSSHALNSDNAVNSTSASHALNSDSSVNSTNSVSSSHALSSNTSVTSAFATNANSSAYAPIEPAASASISQQLGTKQPNLIEGNFYNISSSHSLTASWAPPTPSDSASYATFAVSSSWAPQDPDLVGTTLYTGSTYEITSSWSNKTISASYAPFTPDGVGTTLYTGSTYEITASKAISAISAISASWAPYIDTDTGTTLYTGSTYEITSSWSEWATNAVNGGTQLVTASSYPITSSWSNNSVSASYAPFTPDGVGTTLYTGSTYEITTSISVNSISASSAPIEVGYSASISTIFNTKQPNLITGNTYTITSSWAEKVISASYAPQDLGSGTTLQTGSTYPITASWAQTASWAVDGMVDRNDNIIIGSNAFKENRSNSNNSSLTNVAIGSKVMFRSSGSVYNIAIGQQAGYELKNGRENILIGDYCAGGLQSGSYNVYLGSGIASNTYAQGSDNVAIGNQSFEQAQTAGKNVFIGSVSGLRIRYGNSNIGIGYWAMVGDITQTLPSNNNIAIGENSIYSANGNHQNNIAIGKDSLQATAIDSVTKIIAIGDKAGYSFASGSNCIFLGKEAGYDIISSSNVCIIGGTGSNALKVGIGTNSPATTLHVAGNISCSAIYGTAITAETSSFPWVARSGGIQYSSGSVNIGTNDELLSYGYPVGFFISTSIVTIARDETKQYGLSVVSSKGNWEVPAYASINSEIITDVDDTTPVNSIAGIYSLIEHYGGGSITFRLMGLDVQTYNEHSISPNGDLIGGSFISENWGGQVRDIYGVIIRAKIVGGPEVTASHAVGLYIEESTGATDYNYNIHSVGVNSRNVFEGSVEANTISCSVITASLIQYNSITTSSTAPITLAGFYKIDINGTDYWTPYYSSP